MRTRHDDLKGPGNDRDLRAQLPLSISHDATWRHAVFLYTTNQNTPLFKEKHKRTRDIDDDDDDDMGDGDEEQENDDE